MALVRGSTSGVFDCFGVLAQVSFFDSLQDPVMDLAFHPADTAIAQGDGFWEASFRNVLVDGRASQPC